MVYLTIENALVRIFWADTLSPKHPNMRPHYLAVAWPEIRSLVVTVLPVITFFAGLFADWFKQRTTHGFEEKRQISRVISELLQLRYTLLACRECPELINTVLPEEITKQLPSEFWRSIDWVRFFPQDEKLEERYRKAVDEIASYDPVLAFKLRGKELYFKLRGSVADHFQKLPGSPVVANQVTTPLDREAVKVVEETLRLLAKSYGWQMRLQIRTALKRRDPEEFEALAAQIRVVLGDTLRQMSANTPPSEEPPK